MTFMSGSVICWTPPEKPLHFARGGREPTSITMRSLSLALLRLLEIIGEAARQVPTDFRAQASAIPWRDITGTRDRLIHAYAEVDMDIVWTIVSESLPQLISELENLVPPETD